MALGEFDMGIITTKWHSNDAYNTENLHTQILILYRSTHTYLQRYHMTKATCVQLFKKEDVTKYHTMQWFLCQPTWLPKSHYRSLTDREVGMLLSKIGPHLAATADFRRPENIFKKIQQIFSRKKDMDALVTYTPKNKTSKIIMYKCKCCNLHV